MMVRSTIGTLVRHYQWHRRIRDVAVARRQRSAASGRVWNTQPFLPPCALFALIPRGVVWTAQPPYPELPRNHISASRAPRLALDLPCYLGLLSAFSSDSGVFFKLPA